jgi:hypothetical protein
VVVLGTILAMLPNQQPVLAIRGVKEMSPALAPARAPASREINRFDR